MATRQQKTSKDHILRLIAITAVAPSPTNPRRTIDEEWFVQLAAKD